MSPSQHTATSAQNIRCRRRFEKFGRSGLSSVRSAKPLDALVPYGFDFTSTFHPHDRKNVAHMITESSWQRSQLAKCLDQHEETSHNPGANLATPSRHFRRNAENQPDAIEDDSRRQRVRPKVRTVQSD
ncbi:hypothetical protein LTR35_014132 [Friedmanniomyces endolithicus]|uniref:Uncharacterized protein n=1 Tax=Friedmanniomyces endolithicus TaxID=329885 RepID=A0AAN6J571_9PEZI|nr:hypothetical protein LTR35_014132 [Friedmanniomyces endolithicus]KAK0278245.1 hypothetical protein LTS00_013857 [Friedmanniomyces endolithicus]KAK0316897.1 hypothetical protein LTR82_012039 [Friedmanniomyces endolithicus]KAK0982409.1 hypothetical protein LTR54_014639 [Friedmanniomyces endolithicus]